MNQTIETTAVAVRSEAEAAISPFAAPMTAREISAQVEVIQDVMKAVMKPGVHYGVIPGTGDKPTLLQPGAEKIMMTFRLVPDFTILTKVEEPDFIAFTVKCTLTSLRSGVVVASGIGSCSSRESKYRWRKVGRSCPECGGDTIIKGKDDFGGGWLCWKKNGGCGAKFPDNDGRITKQEAGRIPNPDLWDQHNTILKMAEKRAKVAAVLNATAASDIFTQDVGDDGDEDRDYESPARHAPTQRQQRPAPPQHPDESPAERGSGDDALKAAAAKLKAQRGQAAQREYKVEGTVTACENGYLTIARTTGGVVTCRIPADHVGPELHGGHVGSAITAIVSGESAPFTLERVGSLGAPAEDTTSQQRELGL